MKHLKMWGFAAVVAMVLMVFAAGSASATTLEVEGVAKNVSVSPILTLKSGTSMIIKETAGMTSNTCTGSELKGSTTSPFTGATVTGAVSTLSFTSCERTVTVHKGGTLHFVWTSGTNGTVTSSGAEWTTGSPFGALTCKTGAGTHLGTLTGVKEGNATMDVSAALSCSGISSKLEATYTVTSPSGLGVSAETTPATTLEVGGAAKNEAVTITGSLKSGTSAALKDTAGISINTCTASHVHGATEAPFTGATVTGVVSTLSFSSCERSVTVHKGGTLHFVWTSGTNGTVTSSGAEVTTGSPFGTLNCKTGAGTHLGTLTGVKEGNATMDINAALICSGISSKWEATYTITSPSGLGVVS